MTTYNIDQMLLVVYTATLCRLLNEIPHQGDCINQRVFYNREKGRLEFLLLADFRSVDNLYILQVVN